MRRLLSALLMSVIALPLLAVRPAQAFDDHEKHERREREARRAVAAHRVYDPYRRDYHAWDVRERRAYREYLAERHRSYVAYERQRAAQRRAYWRWRHEREERLEHRR